MKKAAIVTIVIIMWTIGGILLRKYSVIGGEKSEVSKETIKEPFSDKKQDQKDEPGKSNDQKDKGNKAETQEDEIFYQIPKSIDIIRKHYALDNSQVKVLNSKLQALDGLVEESMNNATLDGDVTREEIILRVHHMKRVSDLAMELMVAYEKAEGISFSLTAAECLMMAAYTHDICKFADGNHAKIGAKYVTENIVSLIECTQQQAESIGLLIKYHSDPLTTEQKEKLGDLVILEELLQDADMIDKIRNKGASDDNNADALHFESSKEILNE